MPLTDPSKVWETLADGATLSDSVTDIRSLRVWADGTITFTDEAGNTTTDLPVLASELIPIAGKVTNLTPTGTNLSVLR